MLLIFILLLSSCKKKEDSKPASNSPSPTTPTTTPVSTDFNQYKNEFLSLASQMGATPTTTNLTIVYSTTHTTADGVLGVCSKGGSLREVSINRVYWEAWATNARKDDMEQLLFHELGHCTLNRAHFDTATSGIAQSLMNSYHVNSVYYVANWTYYINELFNPAIAGTVNLASSGNDGWDGSVYASHEAITTYTMTIQDLHDNDDTHLGIEEFGCNEDVINE